MCFEAPPSSVSPRKICLSIVTIPSNLSNTPAQASHLTFPSLGSSTLKNICAPHVLQKYLFPPSEEAYVVRFPSSSRLATAGWVSPVDEVSVENKDKGGPSKSTYIAKDCPVACRQVLQLQMEVGMGREEVGKERWYLLVPQRHWALTRVDIVSRGTGTVLVEDLLDVVS